VASDAGGWRREGRGVAWEGAWPEDGRLGWLAIQLALASSDMERQAPLEDGGEPGARVPRMHDLECTIATHHLWHHLRVSSRRGRLTANVAGRRRLTGAHLQVQRPLPHKSWATVEKRYCKGKAIMWTTSEGVSSQGKFIIKFHECNCASSSVTRPQ